MRKIAILLSIPVLALSACGGDGRTANNKDATVTKTSENTWHIDDDEGWDPDEFIDQTCQTEGRPVQNISSPGEREDLLNIVCGPLPDTTQVPTSTPIP